MPAKKKSPPIQQTAIGDGNLQVVGDQNVVNQTIIQRISNFFAAETEPQRAQRNRRAMLNLVKNTWIKGVFEKSLYNEVLIELGMEQRPGAVDHPWDMQVQMPNQTNHALPSGTSIIDVFDEMNGAMLILGEPGSGKTTMLLELARDCISRAQEDDNQLVPVIFNLSSWNDRQVIDDWLVGELNTKYNIAKQTAKNWVKNDDLNLLLDGLDEVRMEKREACVQAINDFRQRHGLALPIVVCSRIADYETLTTKLNLSGAILLQPLTLAQIDKYFEQAGPELVGAHQALKNDTTLQELVKQPLMLSIMTLAYQSKPENETGDDHSEIVETRRKLLFDAYIQRMFDRVGRTKSKSYAPEQTKHSLAWLAIEMIKKGQSIFLVERLEQSWLRTRTQKTMYRLLSGLFLLLISLVIGVVTLQESGNLVLAIVGTGILIYFIRPFSASQDVFPEQFEKTRWSWKSLWETLWISFRSDLRGMKVWIWHIGMSLLIGVSAWLILSPIMGLVVGLGTWIGLQLIGGFEILEIETRTKANQGISLAMKNAIVFSLPAIIAGILLNEKFVLLIALIMGLVFGGWAVVNHSIIRFLLYYNGDILLNYVHFLNYATERIFLRKVGGGYIFVHRLLMEHFAAMYQEEPK